MRWMEFVVGGDDGRTKLALVERSVESGDGDFVSLDFWSVL